MQAKDAMKREIIHVSPEETLQDAWMLMKHFDIRHILILAEGELVGLVSDRDVLRCATPTEKGVQVPRLPITEVMAENLLTCQKDFTIAEIASTMFHNKIDALPVLDEQGKLEGMITSSDLLSLLFSNPSGATHLADLPFFFELVNWNVYNLKLPRAEDMLSNIAN